MSYEIQYNEDTNTSKYIENGLCIATLDFDNDVFESFLDEDVEQCILDGMYDEMMREKRRYDRDRGYDVRAEQGLYGYGY